MKTSSAEEIAGSSLGGHTEAEEDRVEILRLITVLQLGLECILELAVGMFYHPR